MKNTMCKETILEQIVKRYEICMECASADRAKAFVETDAIVKSCYEHTASFHETRADMLFDLLTDIFYGDEDAAKDFLNGTC